MREGREDRGGRPEQREELGGGSADKVGWVAGQHKPESPVGMESKARWAGRGGKPREGCGAAAGLWPPQQQMEILVRPVLR